MTEFADALKERRQLFGYTQEELASVMGTAVTNVWRWENGKVYPSSKYMKMLGDVLKTDFRPLIIDSTSTVNLAVAEVLQKYKYKKASEILKELEDKELINEKNEFEIFKAIHKRSWKVK